MAWKIQAKENGQWRDVEVPPFEYAVTHNGEKRIVKGPPFETRGMAKRYVRKMYGVSKRALPFRTAVA